MYVCTYDILKSQFLVVYTNESKRRKDEDGVLRLSPSDRELYDFYENYLLKMCTEKHFVNNADIILFLNCIIRC